jgi:hypothetical protein|tara:strand:- start:5935 stop:7671 length:1737 start_codon:yes stop_codon:yes gene_type:complete
MQVSNSNVPKDFDWSFYLSSHPDLMQAGLKTEQAAINHYVSYGKNENRQYKPIYRDMINNTISHNQLVSIQNDEQRIVLFTPWYNPEDNTTTLNNIRCLENNIQNQYIETICLMMESKDTIIPSHLMGHPKLKTAYIDKRLSYADWVVYSQKHYSEYIKILSNTDIYFDETLEHVFTKYFTPKTFYTITRKDLDSNGNIVNSHDTYEDYNNPTNPIYSQDCWIFKDKIDVIDPKYINFELGIGNCDRLFKNYLEKECGLNFINLYKNINAIHLDKRQIKSRQQYPLSKDMIDYKLLNIQDYLSTNDIKPYDNKLEDITLLLTGKEIENGRFDIFIHRLTDSLNNQDKEYAKLLDFNIATQYQISDKQISILEQYFNKINILSLNIPPEYDHYKTESPSTEYGRMSGPNWCFFETMHKLCNYNTTLMLECDVLFGQKWLTNVYNYCLFSGNFWVSGSKNYKNNLYNMHHLSNQHINGGVCLYATGNNNLQQWLHFCKQLLPTYVKHRLSAMPYDYLLYSVLLDFYNNDLDNSKIWNFIQHNYISNKLIYNLTSPDTEKIHLEEFKKYFKYCIIHSKLLE